MNVPISRLFALVLLLFATVVGFTSYWSVIDAENLRDNPENRRLLLEEAQIERGTITTADGELIAESVPIGSTEGEKFFERRYPLADLFGHPVGYYFLDRGRSGVELFNDAELAGRKAEFISILEQLEGQAQEGSDITLTLNAAAQRVAYDGLAGRTGAVVAIEPSTGAIRVAASNPPFDPNSVKDSDSFKTLNSDEESPLLNRATQSGYEPGSTMKVVTATAALDSGEFTPDTVLNGDTGVEISGVPLENSGGQSFGEIDMTTALTNSVNTYWAQVGEQIGNDIMFEYMKRFGFNATPPVDYPPEELNPSGIYGEDGKLLDAGDSIDIGRAAIGQERLLVTPIQMAMVAATVANGGEMMRPTFLQSVTDPDGRITDELDGEVAETVMSAETASILTEMMTNVTREGTASALSVAGAEEFAGKTGTAEIDVEAGINRGWFIGFAPTEDPQVAVAAVVERTSGFGGETAGPIATDVMEVLLNQ
jgi:peptidoglycan glycosyltransferase